MSEWNEVVSPRRLVSVSPHGEPMTRAESPLRGSPEARTQQHEEVALELARGDVPAEPTDAVDEAASTLAAQTLDENEVEQTPSSPPSSSSVSMGFGGEAPYLARRPRRSSLTLKVGMVGDAGCGKTSLMVRYCEGHFDEDYIMTLGVNFLERSVSLRHTDIVFSVWDLGGQSEFRTMLPLVTSDAAAMLFIFDLTRKTTLISIRDWYQQVRLLNVTAVPILVGNKYDLFISLAADQQASIVRRARKYARAMHAPLVFCSASHCVQVQRVFKLVLVRLFDLQPAFERQTDAARGPLCEW
ncbi:small GTP-binding protein of Rab family [Cyanidioschyzon merolae strain 10D]|uniref:Small GTP-binding protein of Rab family n=1 Tax=Cyanidioschyzon merolae (strain NIES-3377 / 10D) TaxID=280699 RepID=M1VBG7_CYAM1|nr:small GTP-binding protein of Rab family [Cyanidioschyzon merolae strain 10D]BAM79657.1 small GTP-binding protein of Rab family [Cyanidioschyzon merolae strain 10D]|eukprot:XP_005535943.1 small GTP-binding protein of Rab family [Cyanidioschyzon merolae strain 10D]